jgi:hypothetical protein
MAEATRKEANLNFKEWLLISESASRPGNKTGLYPLGYGGIGLYPLQDYLTHSADAITYISMDDRLNPKGHEGPPFDITHLKPAPTMTHQKHPFQDKKTPKGWKKPDGIIEPKDDRAPGKRVPPKNTPLPGKIVRPKKWVHLGDGEGGGIKNVEEG